MSTYQILPQTVMHGKLISNPIANNPFISEEQCRRVCDDLEECSAFTYAPALLGKCGERLVHRPMGKCMLFDGIGPTQPGDDITTYIKGPRSSFWVFWVFLALLVLVVFVGMAKRK